MTRRSALRDSRGFCAIGVMHSKTPQNIGTLLRSAHAFGAAFVFTVGQRYSPQCSDTTKAWRHVPLFAFTSVDDLRHHLPYSCPLIGVELDESATALPRFAHPETACYLLGAEDRGLTADERAACHRLVQIPGAAYCLNVAVAGSVILYDRLRQIGPAAS